MRFLVMLFQEEGAWAKAPAGEAERVFQAYSALDEEMKRKGVFSQSIRLRMSEEAHSLHYGADGKTDSGKGPFTPGPEQVGGLYVLECASADEALAWAKRMPNYRHGGLEIRPIWD